MADTPVGSPEWWLRRLHKRLIERRPQIQFATDYYEGAHNLKFMSARFRKAFNAQLDAFADNWCLPTGAPVITSDGVSAINDVKPDDMVLAHDGAFRRVERVLRRPVEEPIVALRTFGSPTARMTANHPVLASRLSGMKSITAKYADPTLHFRCHGTGANLAWDIDVDREWVPAGDLTPGDIVWTRIPTAGPAGTFTATYESLLGWYIAEGSVSDNGRIAISFHEDEVDYQSEVESLLKEVCGFTNVTRVKTTGRCIQVAAYSKEWAARLERDAGRHSYGKRLSADLFTHGDLVPLLRSAFLGDGTHRGHQIGYTTVSLAWASQVQAILARNGVACHWHTSPATEGHLESYRLTISGAHARRLADLLGWTMDGTTAWDKAPSGAIVGDWIGYAVADVGREDYAGDVWDLTVSEAHSFVLPGMLATHNCEVVVDAAEERLNVEGFRVGDAPEGDEDAWRIWQANDMDGQSQLAHTDALVGGVSYVIPWFGAEDGTPEITVANAHDAIVECHPKMHRQRRAGLRLYRDEWGHDHAELFLPDGVHLFRSSQPQADFATVDTANMGWDAEGVQPNPLGVVPVIELPNRPRTRNSRHGVIVQSEIRSIIPLQDAVNKLVADMLVASEKQALPARWATGLEPPVDPETNQPVKPEVDTAELMINTDPAGGFGVFQAADLRNFTIAIDLMIQHIASISRTPPHYLNSSADRLSGESIKAAESGLVSKVHRKQRFFGEAWEETMRLAGQIAGLPQLSGADGAEVIWADAETRTDSQLADSLVKKKDLNVPDEQLWEDAGYSPQQIARFKAMRAESDLFAPVMPEPAVPQPGA